ncbi:leucine-rich repeat receptor protein kinase EMS1 [Amborella trichopoda]|uniref:Leucine-rich repeat-containing N-terminal plant-type domain-containing protein n=1 Tax=Amborella trichopoda TaxID=13333 RepID=W1PNE2_AMBTC|nr:leucine-rich repeat receptor protein kinase EMS1 [Amborella trichopoda]ERN11552.1 hypothetical protein AMTR_s00022p00152760 [Amborella trichopoda]|eukprot:XP_006849971.1 leucine-rich repeat receptor protein kinase EMS1 [Amborella trichopoda]
MTVNVSTCDKIPHHPYSYVSSGLLLSHGLSWLERLTELRFLALDGVDLSIASSAKGKDWAEPISLLSKLQVLRLSNCKISGPIPVTHLLNLTSLSSLYLNFNMFFSAIPPQLVNLTFLSNLHITNSRVRCSSPQHPQIHELLAGDNSDLSIDLPHLFDLPWPFLRILDLSFCNTSGIMSNSMGNISSLVLLSLSSNNIQGPIPPYLTKLSNFKSTYTYLSFNSLTGAIPSSISNIGNLQALDLYQNNLVGQIPQIICGLTSLQILILAYNKFSEIIPSCMGNFTRLEPFDVCYNSLEGNVSLPSLFDNSSPTRVGIAFNGLTVSTDHMEMPTSFQPSMLWLSSCNLQGKIADFISKLKNIQVLYLANNSLTGNIPSWLWQLPRLSTLDLSNNKISTEPFHLLSVLQCHTHFQV